MDITSYERHVITSDLLENQKRLDDRQLEQSRMLAITFGLTRGCCVLLLGNTKMFAEVSCEITEPKASTPNEGILLINFDFQSIWAPDDESKARSYEKATEAQKSLERCIRDSKAVDLESLCIIPGSKVWTIGVEISIIFDEGNIIEAASIAAVSALAHFRLPDVTTVGNRVTVHPTQERVPLALNFHQIPICINLALFDKGKYILVDPIEMEEKYCDSCYIVEIGTNAHQEIRVMHHHCSVLQFLLKDEDVQRCLDIAVKRAEEVTQAIQTALDNSTQKEFDQVRLCLQKVKI